VHIYEYDLRRVGPRGDLFAGWRPRQVMQRGILVV
jgi:hypothetical protein